MLLNRENKENRQVVLTIQVEQSAWEKALEDAYEQSKSLFKKEDNIYFLAEIPPKAVPANYNLRPISI